MRFVSLLAFALAAAPLAAQTTYWVDPVNGNDSNPGTYALPLHTLTQATMLVTSNDHIHLLPGVYGAAINSEAFPLTLGVGTVANNLVIRGIGSVVIDMGGSNLPALRLATGVSGLRVTNITFTNSDQLGWWTRLINSGTGAGTGNAATDVEFDRCKFVNLNRVFVMWLQDNVQRWKIHDNLFVNCTNDAILEYTGDNDIYNNTFYQGAYKAYISDSVTSRCYNNLIVNYSIAFECNNAATNLARFQSNWTYQVTTNTQGSGMGGALPISNVFGVDPLLVNPGAGDFHLQANSPVIEGGNPNIAIARADLDNVSRLVDSDQNGSAYPEIGCYEVSPLSMTATLDPVLRLLTINTAATTSMFSFVLVSFDDGLVTIPGWSPVLINQNLLLGYLLAPAPGNWMLNLNAAPAFTPGTRLVMHAVGLGQGPTLIGGNQVWIQL